jgi:hypothetical protein
LEMNLGFLLFLGVKCLPPLAIHWFIWAGKMDFRILTSPIVSYLQIFLVTCHCFRGSQHNRKFFS